MRSLEHWTKYIEQQEEQLQKALKERATKQNRAASQEPVRRAESAVAATEPPPKPQSPPPVPERPEARRAVETVPAPVKRDAPSLTTAAKLRKKLPEQLLGPDGRQEVAQNSYQGFKETREELLQRLLDPPLTLEETARVLNVCPATVRRYTNRGLLKHFRTAGNQRRFRLSDVLAFLDSGMSDDGSSN